MDEALVTSDSESEPLLYQSHAPKVPRMRTFRGRLIRRVNFLPRQLCLPSKAAVLILFWMVVVSTIYGTVTTSVGYMLHKF